MSQPDVSASGGVTVEHAPGAVLLHPYPHLAYAPEQWGDKVVTEDNGSDAAAVAASVASGRSRGDVAAEFGTSELHVRDCCRWAEDRA